MPWLFPVHAYQCEPRSKDLLERCHQEYNRELWKKARGGKEKGNGLWRKS